MKTKHYLFFIIEVTALIVFTILISHYNLDLRVAGMFYKNDTWYLANKQPWFWFYKYGTLPGIVIGIFALTFLLLKRIPTMRKQFLLLVLALVIGPGLVVNATFKDHWGRPRPRQIKQFDGKWEFREVWQPGIPGRGNSFPSGHAAMGFYLVVFYYIFRRKNKYLRYGALILGITYGILIGIARIVQGAHFVSDILWAAGFTHLTIISLYFWLFLPHSKSIKLPLQPQKARFIKITLSAIFGFLLIYFFLFSKPLYREFQYQPPADSHFKALHLSLKNSDGDIFINIKNTNYPLKMATIVRGAGFPNRKAKNKLKSKTIQDTLEISYSFQTKGLFRWLNARTQIEVNDQYPLQISAETLNGNIFVTGKKSQTISLNLSAPKGKVQHIKYAD